MDIDRDKLMRARMAAGLSIRALAKKAGVAFDTAQEVEAGKRRPHPATAKKLAEAVGLELAELIDWEAVETEAAVAEGDAKGAGKKKPAA